MGEGDEENGEWTENDKWKENVRTIEEQGAGEGKKDQIVVKGDQGTGVQQTQDAEIEEQAGGKQDKKGSKKKKA